MPVVLDPDAVAVYKAFQEAGRPAYETLTADEARAYYSQARFATNPDAPELARVTPLAIPAPHGTIPARLYVPKEPRQNDGLSPALVFFHGGGWVIGDLDSHDVVCRQLAAEGALIVISVDYRLAPEHKFPAAADDAIAATKWIAAYARDLGVDASRLSIGGDSAGGNLAAVVALAARDAGGPALAGQVLIYPATDFAMTHDSHSEPETSVLLTHSVIRWFRDHYLNGAADIHDWRASPARAQNLAGPAPRLRADRRRRSPARRGRRICRAPQAGRRARDLQALPRPVPRLLHHGKAVTTGERRGERDRRLVEGIGLTPPACLPFFNPSSLFPCAD
ncbi:acetyl esterase [Bradyrhizobium liaoningense]